MLHVDIISACCLCGASALVAAGMLLLAESGNAASVRAIRVLVAGFAVLAAGMFPVGFAVDDGAPRHLLVLLATESVLGGTALFGWGFAILSGARPHRILALPLGLILLLDALAWMRSPTCFEWVFNSAGLLIAVAITVAQWRFARRGATPAEKAISAGFALSCAVWAMRLASTVANDGSRSFHASHLPAAVDAWLGVFYGTVPVIVAALALNLVNERLLGRLRALAHTDELTGTLSRRALRERAPELLARQHAGGLQVAALMVDIDHFKGVNDRHGHPAGDVVLQRTAHLVAMNVRSDSMVTRYGGEEFAVLLPVAGLEEARAAAERLRKAIESDVVDFDGTHLGVTVSVGLALLAHGEALDAALARADKALHRAKNAGRNRVDIALAAA